MVVEIMVPYPFVVAIFLLMVLIAGGLAVWLALLFLRSPTAGEEIAAAILFPDTYLPTQRATGGRQKNEVVD